MSDSTSEISVRITKENKLALLARKRCYQPHKSSLSILYVKNLVQN